MAAARAARRAVFVHALSAAGSAAVVAVIYLVIVLGLGEAPGDDADRKILGFSILAAALAAIGYLPVRGRLVAFATRFVYGTREAPGEALRTFGSRMTRAVAMDELLLQLAESLRKTMRLDSAEIYTGAGDVLERAVSVPDASGKSIVLTDRERPVVARAGVSGSAWAAVWLPALLDGREQAQLRVAPISHAGELLGLIVVERAARADAFTDEDDRVLTELARQAGLAFHNSQLDSALQTTLDALRKQADELRESRARIVASGDAERRRVERDLHDGAQQHLVALAINLRLARDIVADDPDAAGEMLGQLAEDVQLTIRELRELAHGIYPPLLADNGLADALRAAASRSPLKVRVTVADDVGGIPPRWRPRSTSPAWRRCRTRPSTRRTRRWSCGCGPLRAACCSRSPTTARGSIPRPPAAATASSTWRTGSAPSAGPSAGTRGRATGPRSTGRSRWSELPKGFTAGRRRRSPGSATAAAARRRRSAPC